ncbi:transposase [Microcoleus sp. PH2017_01_SCD_O_A]|uniref:transposase n=1 Tax=unclassified Microcoleus TaxID=2642155 RepID=UPI001DCBFF56|nr:transposase [Microcoleus sp. PH2017_03_ELD_O_A]MCC3469253.1 transposase [Microcoleus sp. PH2017_06_SFM_O_A]MCC3564056.1 transposase [Microcoleus sp. PH2017_31_RDM_U_A]MCC3593159.1 transposase [Microcoleus sp. PH2017_28_MFU_U_A]MCC3632012.1 transposase [Microcoleus sp. PH2017_39_LGB_O_B]
MVYRFCLRTEEPTIKQHDVVGVDLGVKELATLSTGVVLPNPKHYKTHLSKLRRLSKELSRKKQEALEIDLRRNKN